MNEAVVGSNPIDPPMSILDFGFWILDSNLKSKIPNPKSCGAVAERRMHFPVEEDDDGSSPFGPAISILDFGLPIFDQSKIKNLKSKIKLGRLAEIDQRRPEEP